MKIKLSQITIDTTTIKSIYNKYKKLQAGTKTVRPHYCIEFNNGNFMEITKQEYKTLKGILKNEKGKM